MKKQHILAMAVLCTAVVWPATAVNAISQGANNPTQSTHQGIVSNSPSVISGKQSVENDSILQSAAEMSDEAWLFCSALLGLAGIVIVYRSAH